jgi:hypothetical protein
VGKSIEKYRNGVFKMERMQINTNIEIEEGEKVTLVTLP